ncbi:hypothetical protein KSP39_PZI005837 [Platanthera zijinensis]|uniref:Uncharacterized protein n=1 Tax=Platanthera zijinensis TaxID=2320716 RepID=A0AAP0BTU4_9ASPA
MGLRSELHPVENNGYYVMPQACYTLTLAERRAICNFLENLKVPDGYSSNIKRCVNAKEGKVSRMKAHDCHVFMLDQLAPAFRGIVRKERISEINKQNRSKQKIKSHVGTKSIARTIYEMREAPQKEDELPIYIRLWEKTRKGKHNEWQDDTSEELNKKLLELHEAQIRENGEDKLTPEEAYTKILGYRSGYILGMGPGPRPSERGRTNIQHLEEKIRAKVEAEMMTSLQEMEDRIKQDFDARVSALLEQRQLEDQADITN